jgi:hypothetical protein
LRQPRAASPSPGRAREPYVHVELPDGDPKRPISRDLRKDESPELRGFLSGRPDLNRGPLVPQTSPSRWRVLPANGGKWLGCREFVFPRETSPTPSTSTFWGVWARIGRAPTSLSFEARRRLFKLGSCRGHLLLQRWHISGSLVGRQVPLGVGESLDGWKVLAHCAEDGPELCLGFCAVRPVGVVRIASDLSDKFAGLSEPLCQEHTYKETSALVDDGDRTVLMSATHRGVHCGPLRWGGK